MKSDTRTGLVESMTGVFLTGRKFMLSELLRGSIGGGGVGSWAVMGGGATARMELMKSRSAVRRMWDLRFEIWKMGLGIFTGET